MRPFARVSGLIGLAAILAGCGTGQQGGPSGPTGTEVATVVLRHVPTGTATITYDSSTSTAHVHLSLVGMNPGRSFPAHIHSGQCGTRGIIIATLGLVTADNSGVANATLTANNIVKPFAGGTAYIDVHTGPSLDTAEEAKSTVCGNITAAGSAAMDALPSKLPGYDVSGTATLRLDRGAKTLSVDLHLTGLVPNSRHAAHIHVGQCEAQGPVRYGLPDLVADDQGTAQVTRTFQGVTAIAYGSWYLNVHEGPSPGGTAAGSPSPGAASASPSSDSGASPSPEASPSASVPESPAPDLTTQQGFTPISCGNVAGAGPTPSASPIGATTASGPSGPSPSPESSPSPSPST